MVEPMQIEMVRVDDLMPHSRNARTHELWQIAQIASSIKAHGFVNPVLIDAEGTIIAGHGRVQAAIKLDLEVVPCIRLGHLSDVEVRSLMIADNKIALGAGWDIEMLKLELGELGQAGVDLSTIGWTGLDLAGIGIGIGDEAGDSGGDPPPAAAADEPPIPAQVPRRVVPGEVWQLGRHRLVCGDSGDVAVVAALIRGQADAHALVSDPPYGLAFMGKAWDYDVPKTPLWQLWLEALAPGAHLLVFGGTRTYHRMVVALEDAGVEIRDQMQWLYGSGFPKSHDISKAIDREAGAEGELLRVDHRTNSPSGIVAAGRGVGAHVAREVRAPATNAAREWQGWGSALKPANEPICVARKPIGEDTVAANVLRHGTGGINVDAGRIGADSLTYRTTSYRDASTGEFSAQGQTNHTTGHKTVAGRFPANVVLSHSPECKQVGTKTVGNGARRDAVARVRNNGIGLGSNEHRGGAANAPDSYGTETVEAWDCAPHCAVRMLDEQSGQTPSNARAAKGSGMGYHGAASERGAAGHADSGGASRFFYCAKSSRSDRGEGNTHATVKPLRLMEYLVRLVTADGQTVLEPFAGSGTTLLACETTGRSCLASELDPVHCDIILARWEALTSREAVKAPAE